MSNLNEPQLEKKKTARWFELILLISAVLLGVGYTLRWLTPTTITLQPTLNRNYQGSTTSFDTITYVGALPNFPAELAVATAENFVPLTIEDRTIKNTLIEKYELQRHPEIPNLWLSPEYALQEIEQTGSYELSSQIPLVQGEVVDSVAAFQAAERFVRELFPESNLQRIENRVVYREADVHGDIVGATDAGLVEIPFGYTLDSYPLYLEKSVEYPLTILINADNQVQKANFHPFFLTPIIDGKIKTLTVTQALENVAQDKATIISSHYDGFEDESLEQITSGSMSSVTIEYRVSADTKRIVPYYRFSGQLVNNQGQQFYGEIITPAVQTEADQS